MWTINSPEVSRNYGFWNEEEQQRLLDAHVAIGGVGGDGFLLGWELAMNGVRNFTIADPEVFEPENVNRVPGATTTTVGRPKAEVFRERVLDIHPDANVTIFKDGVTPENAKEFVKDATLVFDETELRYLHVGTALARAAREKGIPNVMVMNVGFAAQVTSFHPDSKHTFERFMGIPKDTPLDEIRDMQVDLSRCVPYLPPYVDMKTLLAVQEGAPLPSIAQGVNMAAALGGSQGFLHIVRGVDKRRPEPVWAPKVRYMDALTGESGETRHTRLSHFRHAARMAIRSMSRRNASSAYTQADRERRAAVYAETSAGSVATR